MIRLILPGQILRLMAASRLDSRARPQVSKYSTIHVPASRCAKAGAPRSATQPLNGLPLGFRGQPNLAMHIRCSLAVVFRHSFGGQRLGRSSLVGRQLSQGFHAAPILMVSRLGDTSRASPAKVSRRIADGRSTGAHLADFSSKTSGTRMTACTGSKL